MTQKKKEVFLSEIAQYLEYDNILSKAEKQSLLNLKPLKDCVWANTIYDYFFSHISNTGKIVSLQNFFLENKDLTKELKQRYQKADQDFLANLFKTTPPLFFLDVDNTLTDQGYLSPQKIEFIGNYADKERIILTTGKAYDAIKGVMAECKITDNYASCLNGSVLVDKGKCTCINKVGKVSKQIVDELIDAPFDTIVYYDDGIRLVKPLSQKNLDLMHQFSETYIDDGEIDYDKVVKVLFFIYEGESDKEQLVKTKIAKYDDLICMRTAGHTYEVLNKSQHKGNTVKIISKLLNRYYRTTIGVGDSMNDSQLLNYVGKPYVVSTASCELKSFGYEVGDIDRNVDIVKIIQKHH
ncbi:MAG: HAD family phosphatase [Clostridia bacterium]|nr:HAD family phosphatase [Clostridia bacterium]